MYLRVTRPCHDLSCDRVVPSRDFLDAKLGFGVCASAIKRGKILSVRSSDLLNHPNRATLYLLYTSVCTGELNAIRKHKCFFCCPFYVKGVSLGYVGRT